MRSDSVKNMSAYADQNHAPSLTDVRLEFTGNSPITVEVKIVPLISQKCMC